MVLILTVEVMDIIMGMVTATAMVMDPNMDTMKKVKMSRRRKKCLVSQK